MKLSSDITNLNEEILDSFKKRFRENEDLLSDVQKTLDRFQEDYNKMIMALQTSFTNGEHGRLVESKKQLKEYVIQMKKISRESQKMTAILRADLDEGKKNSIQEFIDLMDTIHEEITDIFTYTQTGRGETEEIRIDPKLIVKTHNQIKTSTEFTLKDRILDHISEHPNGVKVSEMEEPLGETRMKLGFVAKILLDEGKVQKIDSIYFPIKIHSDY